MGRWSNPLSSFRSTTIGIISLTGMWTLFQILDPSPPQVLDQLLVAAFGIWFATEAKRNAPKKGEGEEEEDDDDDED